MKRTPFRRSTIAATMLTVATLLVVASPADAITNGEPDGDRHPYVGVLVSEWQTPGVKQRFCSGTLVAPRVMISAAHCYSIAVSDGLADQIFVSFDPVYDAYNPGVLYHATMVPHPEFEWNERGFMVDSNSPDVAVVHLDEAPPITPATLPTEGLLSSVDVRGETFTSVGYGRTRADETSGPNNIEPNFFPSVRNLATQEFRSLQPDWLTLSGNPSTGEGGPCYGDSGGPQFLRATDVTVSVTTFTDGPCRSLTRSSRLDTSSVRQFLASQGVQVP
jgi:secreted trypsin-like serine protease